MGNREQLEIVKQGAEVWNKWRAKNSNVRIDLSDPAIQKHNELRLIKAREPKIRSANDFIEDKGL